jgi:IS5 family transposase
MGKTEEITKKAPQALDLTQTRGTKNRKLTEEEKETNRLRSKTRSRGEHIFLVAKKIFGFSKVRYKGLTKNTNFAFVLFALSNLYMVRRDLLASAGA